MPVWPSSNAALGIQMGICPGNEVLAEPTCPSGPRVYATSYFKKDGIYQRRK